jgi:hypothetical protein
MKYFKQESMMNAKEFYSAHGTTMMQVDKKLFEFILSLCQRPEENTFHALFMSRIENIVGFMTKASISEGSAVVTLLNVHTKSKRFGECIPDGIKWNVTTPNEK